MNKRDDKLRRKRDWSQIADEICECGAKKSAHDGPIHHGGCTATGCEKFSWHHFIDKNGKQV